MSMKLKAIDLVIVSLYGAELLFYHHGELLQVHQWEFFLEGKLFRFNETET
jgi:hypothetical protein